MRLAKPRFCQVYPVRHVFVIIQDHGEYLTLTFNMHLAPSIRDVLTLPALISGEQEYPRRPRTRPETEISTPSLSFGDNSSNKNPILTLPYPTQVFPENEILSILPPYLRIPAVLYAYRAAVPRLPLLCQIEMSYPGFLAMMVRNLLMSLVFFASNMYL